MTAATQADVRFDVTDEERALVKKIVARAVKLFKGYGIRIDRVSLTMDLEAVHCNDVELKFQKLLAFDDSNFGHDISGIMNTIDRTTGKLTRCFLPRSVVPAKERTR